MDEVKIKGYHVMLGIHIFVTVDSQFHSLAPPFFPLPSLQLCRKPEILPLTVAPPCGCAKSVNFFREMVCVLRRRIRRNPGQSFSASTMTATIDKASWLSLQLTMHTCSIVDLEVPC